VTRQAASNPPSAEPLTLVLSRQDSARLLALPDCIDAVEEAFRLHAAGMTVPPAVLGVHLPMGGIHIKTAGLTGDRPLFAAKINANLPGNPERHGLPTIQGVIVLFNTENGLPLAVLDSIEITSRRTAAATAVAAKYLARPDARTVTVCGCGEQGRSQLRALALVRELRTVFAYDQAVDRAERYAEEMAAELGLEVLPVRDLRAATLDSDVCVACTTARRFILERSQIAPGSFIAGVGADHPEKQELDPALLASSTVVADHLEQCATIGDLHHAIDAGLMSREDVHAELAEIVAGRKPGRRSAEEIIVFDSTGTALQDVAAAALVYHKAVAGGFGLPVALGSASPPSATRVPA
jgi:ornithine cyclodeaminase/alanine dehydrogenase-like protein (mu-crystallin family)